MTEDKKTTMDSLIYTHLRRFSEVGTFRSSLDHFRETGNASGSFRDALHSMMEEYASQFKTQEERTSVKDRLPVGFR